METVLAHALVLSRGPQGSEMTCIHTVIRGLEPGPRLPFTPTLPSSPTLTLPRDPADITAPISLTGTEAQRGREAWEDPTPEPSLPCGALGPHFCAESSRLLRNCHLLLDAFPDSRLHQHHLLGVPTVLSAPFPLS